jgi:hypothetical protein
VSGVFSDQEQASRALAQLLEHHFEPEDDISVVLTDEWTAEHEDVPIRDKLMLIEGAKWGGAIGAVVGAVGAGMVAAGLVAGPAALVAVGPVIAALEGALAVGGYGVMAGWLVGLGIEREEADFHAGRVEEGAVWIGVHANGARADTAREILAAAGAEFFEDGHRPPSSLDA